MCRFLSDTFWGSRALYGLGLAGGILLTLTGAFLIAAFSVGLRSVDGQCRAKWGSAADDSMSAKAKSLHKLMQPFDLKTTFQEALTKIEIVKDIVKQTLAVDMVGL
jgi:hypothetical protein